MTDLRWVEPFSYKAGGAFRIMPVAEKRRGDRVLSITPDRLQEMAANYNAGRPRWKIPIYAGHPTNEQPDPPKLGNVQSLFYKHGDGLYAVPEWGRKAESMLADGEYQYNSPGVLWSLNGSAYTDDQGNQYDNVIDHVALTNRPFFGADTQLFSADAVEAEIMAVPASKGVMRKLSAPNATNASNDPVPPVTTDGMNGSNANPPELPRNSKNAGKKKKLLLIGKKQGKNKAARKALMNSTSPAKYSYKEQPMSKKDKKNKGERAETMSVDDFDTISADEFAAVQAKANKAEALEAQANSLKTQLETFGAELAREKNARKLEQWTVTCDKFTALPVRGATLAEKFMALEAKDAELAKFFSDQMAAADRALQSAGLFAQLTNDQAAKGPESFTDAIEKVLADQFKGDASKYGEATRKAGELYPDLAAEYRHLPRAR